MSVIEFKRKEAPPESWSSGAARCMECGHRWQATAPAGTVTLECPNCHTEKGTFSGAAMPASGYIWSCNCGNDLFRLTPATIMCARCGADVVGYP